MTDPNVTTPPGTPEMPSDASAAETTLQSLAAERDDFRDKWARARADLENYRRRIQREMDDDRKYAATPIVKALLPGIDGLQRALKAASASRNVDELIAGVEMVAKQFEAALIGLGVQPIEAIGKPFDPNVHEAIAQVPNADQPAMTVIDDVERGYTLHERIVRPSKVIVSAGPPQS
ncbi:MAG TPA: nucleotide exchange factor GrpE [Planctomycetaceae bacterium]|jgi:molecular chaperone GrpE|nr:nucleotide exchange factor GrpE [Planctomycetaceae bacterium]